MDRKYKVGYYFLYGIKVDFDIEKTLDLSKAADERGDHDAIFRNYLLDTYKVISSL